MPRGFTLLEILITVSIIGIIGVIAIPNFKKFYAEQEVRNAGIDLVTLLSQAQSNAQSGVKCTNTAAAFWEVVVGRQELGLRAVCAPLTEPPSIEAKKTIQIPEGIKVSVEGCLPQDSPTITFSTKEAKFYCSSSPSFSARASFLGADFIIKLERGGIREEFQINKRGIIQKL